MSAKVEGRRSKVRIIRHSENGYLMLMGIITGAVFIAVALAITQASLSNYTSARKSLAGESALEVAEAGGDNAVFNINQNNAYAGTNTICPISGSGSNPVTLFNNSIQGRGTYETCVTNGSITNEKVIYAVGKVYQPASASSPLATRTIRLIIEGSATGYAVQTGPGGLTMTNSASISNGSNVYVGGFLTMSNTAQIGSSGTPATVNVANNRCPMPADSTYPQICSGGNGANPISLSNQAHIYGSVSANGQTNGAGMSNPGLTASSGVAATTLPTYDRAGQKAAVSTAMTASNASCSGNGSVTWPANVHITGGNVSLSNNCIATVKGNVWIDGALSLSNKSSLVVDGSVTSTPTVMVDSQAGISLSNQSTVSANANGVGSQFITFWSKGGCSPDCSALTGPNLQQSQSVTTISLNNQGLGAGSTFYAYWTNVSLNNGGSVSSVLGQSVTLSNTGNITFGGTTVGSTLSWAVRYYEQL